jgi:hypothetical protein
MRKNSLVLSTPNTNTVLVCFCNPLGILHHSVRVYWHIAYYTTAAWIYHNPFIWIRTDRTAFNFTSIIVTRSSYLIELPVLAFLIHYWSTVWFITQTCGFCTFNEFSFYYNFGTVILTLHLHYIFIPINISDSKIYSFISLQDMLHLILDSSSPIVLLLSFRHTRLKLGSHVTIPFKTWLLLNKYTTLL